MQSLSIILEERIKDKPVDAVESKSFIHFLSEQASRKRPLSKQTTHLHSLPFGLPESILPARIVRNFSISFRCSRWNGSRTTRHRYEICIPNRTYASPSNSCYSSLVLPSLALRRAGTRPRKHVTSIDVRQSRSDVIEILPAPTRHVTGVADGAGHHRREENCPATSYDLVRTRCCEAYRLSHAELCVLRFVTARRKVLTPSTRSPRETRKSVGAIGEPRRWPRSGPRMIEPVICVTMQIDAAKVVDIQIQGIAMQS